MKKKIISMVLATAMVMGSAMTVGAAEITDSKTEAAVGGNSSIQLPTIKVTVPTTADIVINPFQMAYDKDGVKGNSQIISVEQEISSLSNVEIAVNVSGLTTKNVSQGITIATKDISKSTNKSALLYLEVLEPGTDGKYTFASTYNNKSANQIVIPNATEEDDKGAKDAIVTMAVSNGTDATKVAFKIGGSLVANPVDESGVAAPWVSTDTIGVEWKFTFTPQIVTATTSS